MAASNLSPLESTAHLLERVRQGDGSARERLVRRYLPALERWARGRLPGHARDMADNCDLVQEALDHVDRFGVRREGAFLACLRQILLNEIRGELRRVARRPGRESLDDAVAANTPSPLEQAVTTEALDS